MHSRRSSPLFDKRTPAILPDLTPKPRPSGQLSPAQLGIELFSIRRQLRAERIANKKREDVLVKYNELLEKVIAAQREAFALLSAPLVPNPLKAGK